MASVAEVVPIISERDKNRKIWRQPIWRSNWQSQHPISICCSSPTLRGSPLGSSTQLVPERLHGRPYNRSTISIGSTATLQGTRKPQIRHCHRPPDARHLGGATGWAPSRRLLRANGRMGAQYLLAPLEHRQEQRKHLLRWVLEGRQGLPRHLQRWASADFHRGRPKHLLRFPASIARHHPATARGPLRPASVFYRHPVRRQFSWRPTQLLPCLSLNSLALRPKLPANVSGDQ